MYTSLYELNNVNDDKWNRFHFLFLNCCLLCSSPRPNICKIKKLQDRKIENDILKTPRIMHGILWKKAKPSEPFADTLQPGSYE